MDAFFNELLTGLPQGETLARVVFRLGVAALLGGIIGVQRERVGKAAGLRTHMLVALGSALFVVAPIEFGMSDEAMSRIIQGLVTGVGFLGAGAILKLEGNRQITGLTSAAGLWLTAAVGIAAGLGQWGSAVVGVVSSLLILEVVARIEIRLTDKTAAQRETGADSEPGRD